MDTRRRCCFTCDLGRCFSTIQAVGCGESQIPQTFEWESPGQVFTWTGSVSREGSNIATISGEYTGISGIALSNEPIAQQEVIDRYGLSSYTFVDISGSQPTSGIYKVTFSAYNRVVVGNGVPLVGVFASSVPSRLGAVLNVSSDSGVSDDVCGTFENGCETFTGERSASRSGATHRGAYLSTCGSETVTRLGTAEVTIAVSETLPTFLDGTDGGFDCSVPSAQSTPNPADAAIAEYMAQDPVHQCRTCGG